jgi:hypothetical protein
MSCRQATRNEVVMRIEKEREELGTCVESRARQAEENCLRMLTAYWQRWAALRGLLIPLSIGHCVKIGTL